MKMSPGFRFGLYLQASGLLTEPRIRPTHLRSQGCPGPGLASPIVWPSKCPASPLSHLAFQPPWGSWQFLNTPSPQITAPLPRLLFSFPGMLRLSFSAWQTFSLTEAGLHVLPPKPNPIFELNWGLWESRLILRARGSQLPRITWWDSFLQEIRLQEGLILCTVTHTEVHFGTLRLPESGAEGVHVWSAFLSHPMYSKATQFLFPFWALCFFSLVKCMQVPLSNTVSTLVAAGLFQAVQLSVLLLVRELLRPQNSASQGMSFHHRSLTNSGLTGAHLSLISVGKLGRLRRNPGNWQMYLAHNPWYRVNLRLDVVIVVVISVLVRIINAQLLQHTNP